MENSVQYSGLSAQEVLQVEAVADNSTGLAGAMAQGLLNVFYGYDYQLTPKIFQAEQQRPSTSPAHNTAIEAYQPLAAMPNPARDAVTFYYNLKEKTAMSALRVYDINGLLIETFELEGQNGHINWDASSFAHGVYYCKIEQQGKAFPALKLVLMK